MSTVLPPPTRTTATTTPTLPAAPMPTRLVPVRQRRHTLYFLEHAKRQRPVFLDTEVDMSAVVAHRAAAAGNPAYICYVLWATGRVLARHPRANAAMAPGWPSRLRTPKIARYRSVTAKVALDRSLNGERVVLSAILPKLDTLGLGAIVAALDRYRGDQVDRLPELAPITLLARLPSAVGRLAFDRALHSPQRRAALLGTVSVSSLGHRPVDGFHASGGTALTICTGRIADRPVARHGRVAVAPTMRLSLAFDHRVVDGADAADVLGDLKQALEGFGHASDVDC